MKFEFNVLVVLILGLTTACLYFLAFEQNSQDERIKAIEASISRPLLIQQATNSPSWTIHYWVSSPQNGKE